jgi:hypothetical protein
MYEFYFRSGSFYLMKDQPEVVPTYGGDTLWEIDRDRLAAAPGKPTRDDLAALLKGPETVYVFSRPQYLTTGMGVRSPAGSRRSGHNRCRLPHGGSFFGGILPHGFAHQSLHHDQRGSRRCSNSNNHRDIVQPCAVQHTSFCRTEASTGV